MNNLPTYQERREQLAHTLRPQNIGENAVVDYLATVVREQHSTFVGMVERRTRTTARAARMHLAEQVLMHWQPDVASPPDTVAVMERYASGADPAAGTEPEQMAGSAADYQRGFGAGIEHALAQQLADTEPEHPHEDVRTAVSLAYERGFAEGWDEAVARCRREQLAGREPEVWHVERPGGEQR
jgi:hypothetical protein